MTFPQVIAAAFAFGFASYIARWAAGIADGFLRGTVVAFINRRAVLLRMHKKHCANCCEPMIYYCHRCGHHDEPVGPDALDQEIQRPHV